MSVCCPYCQGVEIQRVWSLHDVLLSVDYTSEDNKQIIDLLLQCFHRPTYIRSDDVSRVISRSCVCIWMAHSFVLFFALVVSVFELSAS